MSSNHQIKIKFSMVHYRRGFFVGFTGLFDTYILLHFLSLCILRSRQVGFVFGLCLHISVMHFEVRERNSERKNTLSVITVKCTLINNPLPQQHYQYNHYYDKDHVENDWDNTESSQNSMGSATACSTAHGCIWWCGASIMTLCHCHTSKEEQVRSFLLVWLRILYNGKFLRQKYFANQSLSEISRKIFLRFGV